MLTGSENVVHVYADASFSKEKSLAVIGFVIFNGKKIYDRALDSGFDCQIKKISESNNIRAEILGVIEALECCSIDWKIYLYTDCQSVANLLFRRENLEAKNFISQSKNCLLANADLYRKFFSVFDKFKPEIYWVKGHSKTAEQTKEQKIFSCVDKAVRKELRKIASDTIIF